MGTDSARRARATTSSLLFICSKYKLMCYAGRVGGIEIKGAGSLVVVLIFLLNFLPRSHNRDLLDSYTVLFGASRHSSCIRFCRYTSRQQAGSVGSHYDGGRIIVRLALELIFRKRYVRHAAGPSRNAYYSVALVAPNTWPSFKLSARAVLTHVRTLYDYC